MTFRVSEVYASVQGEGPNVGLTTVFCRFGGCNLRCPGWPCDTQHAIDPAYRDQWDKVDPDQLAERVRRAVDVSGARIVTLTGGEPFLQRDTDLELLTGILKRDGLTIEAFTNGTLPYPEWAVEQIHMIVDWKMPGSGEYLNAGQREMNLQALDESSIWHSIKFVCKDYEDFLAAVGLYEAVPQYHDSFHWFYGKVWDGIITDAKLAEHVMKRKLPWRLNYQLHNTIWPANERGR